MNMSPADHAFESFLASRGKSSFEGVELVMYRFFERHPGQEEYRATEAAIRAYEKGSRK